MMHDLDGQHLVDFLIPWLERRTSLHKHAR